MHLKAAIFVIIVDFKCTHVKYWSTVIRFFSSSKISSKKYSRKIIFEQTKLNKNNFTSHVWWALIEEIAPRAKEMAGEKEMACCARGYHVYKDIWAAATREVLVCNTEPTNVRKIFVLELYSHKIFSYVFCVRNNENKANYSISNSSSTYMSMCVVVFHIT